MKRIVNSFSLAFLLPVSLYTLPVSTSGEGTDRVRISIQDQGMVQLIARNGSGRRFAFYDGEVDYRLNIHICSPGETINIGFSKTENTGGGGDAGTNENIVFRVKDPSGAVVFGPQQIQKAPDSLRGQIFSYAQALQGPTSISPNGYQPFQMSTSSAGDYYVEFNVVGSTNNNMSNLGFRLFDITVVDQNNQRKDGRLWSKAWMLNTGNFANPYNGSFYIMSNDGIVTKMNLNGTQPYEFIFSANNTGTDSTGNSGLDRMSVYNNNKTYPLYKVFLNDPDTACYPSGVLGAIVNTPTLTGCAPNLCINFTVTAPGQVQAFLDLNGVPDYQSGTRDVILQSLATTGDNCIPWNGRDGLGNLVSTGNNIPINLLYMNGLTHLPIFDVENNTKGYLVTYVRPLPNVLTPIQLFWDDSRIRPRSGPSGIPNTAGCIGACHTWIFSSGDNNNPDYGNLNTINTWWYINPSSKDIAPDLSSQQIDANRNTLGNGRANDTSICASAKELGLFGSLLGNNRSLWTKLSGSGSILDPGSLTTKYLLSPADSTLTSISLVLSSDNGCGVVRDTISIHLNPNPQLILSAPPVSCKLLFIQANAFVQHAKGIVWQGSSQRFTPSAFSNSVLYEPTEEEKANKLITLTASTIPDSLRLCTVKTRTLIIPLQRVVEFGNIIDNQKYCNESQPYVELMAPNAATYAWYSELGTLLGQASSLRVSPSQNARYGLKLTNQEGCSDSIILSVHVVCPPRLYVPNVITPSSTDINSNLSIYGAHYTNFEITVFSRWGEVIFNSKDPKKAWNGVYKNEDMPIGVYPWIVTYEGDSEEYKGPHKKVGDVTVVR